MPLSLTYDAMQKEIAPFTAKARTESRAFLAWFLTNIYRLEETAAQDAICDGTLDKGVDGIYVDEANSRIDIFQGRTVQSDDKKIGDTLVKEMAGTLKQFEKPESILDIASTTQNVDLKRALTDLKIADLVTQGYVIRGILVSNAYIDPGAEEYIQRTGTPIELWDRKLIEAAYVSPEHSAPPAGPFTFDTFGYDVARYSVGSTVLAVAPLRASELVKLDGIQSGLLFDYNVRHFLGRTNVNKDIARNVQNTLEHKNFLLYHNGVIIVADQVDLRIPGKITIVNYLVVNGCQSLTVLWQNQKTVTPDLRIIARIIQVDRESPLMKAITHNSNNQNGIKARDFQSNSAIQSRLRNEFDRHYGGQIGYAISRGDVVTSPEIIDNELAARVLLALDLKQPWTCHQTYKLFDELHADIFARPEVNAHRIVAAIDVYKSVESKVPQISDQLLAKYTLTKYFLIYLVGEVLRLDPKGKALMANPKPFVESATSRKKLRTAVEAVVSDLIIDTDAEVGEKTKAEGYFDFKRILKSPAAASAFAKEILSPYQKAVSRKRAPSFAELITA